MIRTEEKKVPFDLQPTLHGEYVRLSPLRAEHYDDLFFVASDPRIWEQHPVTNRYEKESFRAFFRESLDSGGALIAVDTRTQSVIGATRFHGYDEKESEVEIGWTFLARSHWGGIYNGEMKRLMLHHAFNHVQRVVFLVVPSNLRSQRAVEKIGATCVGSRPDAGGRVSDVYCIARGRLESRQS